MDTSMQTLQELVSKSDAFNSKINETLNKAVETNAGKEPLHSQLLACHAANDACGRSHVDIATWGTEHEAQYHAGTPEPEPEPVPPNGTVQELGAIALNATTPWEERAAGQTYAYQAMADGEISSVGDSGGAGVWGHVGAAALAYPFPNDETVTQWGRDTHNPIKIKAGQWYSFFQETNKTINMRTTLAKYG